MVSVSIVSATRGSLPSARALAALVDAQTTTLQRREGNGTLREGQMLVVPRGVEHCPIADGEVDAMLIEPVGVINTGRRQRPAHRDVRRLTGIVTVLPMVDPRSGTASVCGHRSSA